MKKAMAALSMSIILSITVVISIVLSGCTEAERVSYNVSEEADNFKVFRRVTVINARSDELVLELDGYFSIKVDNDEHQLEITCQTGENSYTKLKFRGES